MSEKEKKNGLINRTTKSYSLDNHAIEVVEKLHKTKEIPRTRLLDKAIFLLEESYESDAFEFFKCLSHIHAKTGIDKSELVSFAMEQLLKHYIKHENDPE